MQGNYKCRANITFAMQNVKAMQIKNTAGCKLENQA